MAKSIRFKAVQYAILLGGGGEYLYTVIFMYRSVLILNNLYNASFNTLLHTSHFVQSRVVYTNV